MLMKIEAVNQKRKIRQAMLYSAGLCTIYYSMQPIQLRLLLYSFNKFVRLSDVLALAIKVHAHSHLMLELRRKLAELFFVFLLFIFLAAISSF